MFAKRQYLAVAATTIAVAVIATGCSSSKDTKTTGAATTTGSTGSVGGGTVKIGVLTDSTGVAASGFQTTEIGIKAYVNSINAAGGINGQKLSYVMADS